MSPADQAPPRPLPIAGRGAIVEPDPTQQPLLHAFAHHTKVLIGLAADEALKGSGRAPSITFVCYDHPEVAAYSARVPDGYQIGISLGTEARLRELFAPIATPKVVGHLLDLKTPRAHPQLEGALVMELCKSALLTLFGHEMRHILGGQLDYLSADPGSLLRPDLRNDPITHQVLEMDADAAAVFFVLARMADALAGPAISPFASAENLLFIWSLATTVLLHQDFVHGPVFETLRERSHTPGQVRWLQLHGMAFDNLRHRQHTHASNENHRLWRASSEIHAAYRFSGLLAVQDAVEEDAIQQALHEDARRLLLYDYRQRWRELRPDLCPLAYVGLTEGNEPNRGSPSANR